MGIRVEGCLLTCEGADACVVCKDEPRQHHGARYLTQFSKEHPHFEVIYSFHIIFRRYSKLWLSVNFEPTYLPLSFLVGRRFYIKILSCYF